MASSITSFVGGAVAGGIVAGPPGVLMGAVGGLVYSCMGSSDDPQTNCQGEQIAMLKKGLVSQGQFQQLMAGLQRTHLSHAGAVPFSHDGRQRHYLQRRE